MSFNGLLNQTISVKNPTGVQDLHGKRAFGASVDLRCRFERVYRTIRTAEREREPIHAQAMIGPGTVVQIGAQVTFGSDKFRVIERQDAPGRSGAVHHYELMLQQWEFGS